jgi:LPXTG-motif cell wall-anchored protein
MASSNQGGSILSFLLIGGVLTVLLIGGAYAIQRRTAQPAAAPVATQNKPADDKKVAVAPNKDAEKQEAAKKEEAKKAEQQKVAAKQEAEKKEAAKSTSPAPAAPATTELPKTGSAESVSAVLGLGLLTGMAVAYVRSRSRTAAL